MPRISHALLPLILAFGAAACSTSDDAGSKFNSSNGGSGSSGASGTSGNIDIPTPSDELKGCAAQTSVADITPLRLFFVIDRSGSMCETEAARSCASATSKWQQTKEALKSFFVNPTSRNVSASFISFAQVEPADCNAATYEKTEVKETALPDGANVLGNRLDNLVPDGNTPTLAALSGAVAYVKRERVQTIADGGKMAIVFASDGLPFGCNDTLAQSSAVLADAKAAGIPVYVIGVGRNLDNLDQLAAASGTNNGKAFLVGASDLAKVGAELTAAIGQIRTTQLSCVVKVPAPPPNTVLNPKKVNVQVTSGAGTKAAIKQSQGCADGAGWEYDDPAKPTRIKLCDTACTRIKNDQKSKIDVVLGCDTLTVVN